MKRFFPAPKKILRSLKLRSKEFLRENTLHGFPYFVDPRRPLWERIIWFLCTAASIGAAIGIIVTIMEKFETDPTLTGLDTHTDELELDFPSITLCGTPQKFNLGRHENNAEYLRMMYDWSWTPIKDFVDPRGETYAQLFYSATADCSDMFENCTYGDVSKPCGELFRKILTPRGICCFTEGTIISEESRPWEISFDTTAFPQTVDIREQASMPPLRHLQASYNLRKPTTIQISIEYTYSTEGLGFLPKKQRKCLLSSESASYSTCYFAFQRQKILETCKCLPWFLSILGENNECTKAGYNCLAGNKTALAMPSSKCYLPCNHAAYRIENVNEGVGNTVKIYIPSWPSVVYKREVRFGWLDLLVSFGGIAGLFVGYSLLTTVELGYYLSMRTYCGAVLTQSNKTIKVKVPKRRVIQVIDIKKDYYDYVH